MERCSSVLLSTSPAKGVTSRHEQRELSSNCCNNVTLDQMAALIAENLMVPVECVTVHYRLASGEYDGLGFVTQHATGIVVVVDNVAKEAFEQSSRYDRIVPR